MSDWVYFWPNEAVSDGIEAMVGVCAIAGSWDRVR